MPKLKRSTFIHRFWSRVARGAGDACWPYLGARCGLRGEYGHSRFPGHGRTQAHRVAWILTNGDVPAGLLVLHRCDNPICCNPGHLWLGTHKENTADMIAKGRGRGSKPPSPKVVEMRRLYVEEGLGTMRIAERFGVSQPYVSIVCRGLDRGAGLVKGGS